MYDLNKSTTQIFLDRFCNRSDVYAQQYWNEQEYGYMPVWKPPSLELIASHLNGEVTIGWYSSSRENLCKWLVFDFDDQTGSRQRLAQLLRKYGWHVVLEGGRKEREGHLWLFFDVPIPADILRQFGRLFLRQAGIPRVELFPKQDRITGLGNLVRSPLGIHRKPAANGERGYFDEVLNHDLNHQLEWFVQQKLNKASTFFTLIEQLHERERINRLISTNHPYRSSNSRITEWIDFTLYAQRNSFHPNGQYYVGPCPSCKVEGHDSTDDHLSISNEGAVHCWRGCSFTQIVDAAKAANTC